MKAEHRIKASAAAEHRKELHTNALADRMGRFMQTVRQKPRRRTVLIWVAGIAVVIGLLIWWGVSRSRANQNSLLWVVLFRGSFDQLKLIKDDPTYSATKQGDIANLQYQWPFLWDTSAKWQTGSKSKSGGNIVVLTGISNVKSVPKSEDNGEAIKAQRDIFLLMEHKYDELYEKFNKADPILASEALYNKAVVQETLATYGDARKYLDKAKGTFTKVRDEFKETGHGVMADQRLKESYDTVEKFNALKNFYQEFTEKVPAEKQAEIEGD